MVLVIAQNSSTEGEVKSVVYKLLEVLFLMLFSLGIAQTSAGVMFPILVTTLQKRYRQFRENPEESKRNDKSFGKCDLQGKVERVGFV